MNRVVLVTGATRGIGAEIARRFAQAGYDVAIGCRSEQSREKQGEAVAAQCAAHGVRAACFVADVTDFGACAGMVKQVAAALGGVDVLVNNAGITKDGLVVRMSEQSFDSVIDANLKSAFNMIRHVTPLMVKKHAGCIINIASVIGLWGNAGQANYAASKAGLIGLTKSVAKELGVRGIRCNAIAPGFIESDMTDVMPEEQKQAILSRTSLRRFGCAADVAETALFLAAQAFITGQVLPVDGGLSV